MPSSILSDELATGRPVGAGGDDEDLADAGQACRDRLRRSTRDRRRPGAGPGRRSGAPRRPVAGPGGRRPRRRRPAGSRSRPCGTSPGRAPRSRGPMWACCAPGERSRHGDQGGARSGARGRRPMPRSSPSSPPSCEIPMTSPVAGRIERQLEGLPATGSRAAMPTRAGQAGRADGLAQDLGDALRGVLGRAAAGQDDRAARLDRPRDGPRQCRGRARRVRRSARGSARPAPARPRSCRSCGTAAPPRRLGCEVDRQGSGGPGSGAVGSKVVVLIGGA